MMSFSFLFCLLAGGAAESIDQGLTQRCGFHCRAAARAEQTPLNSDTDLSVDAAGRFASMLEVSSSLSSRASSGRVGSGIEELEDWVAPDDGGASVRGSLSDAQLFELTSGITKETFGKTLHNLADKQTSRFIGNEGNKGAANFIEKSFAADGSGLETYQQPLTAGNSKTQTYLLEGSDGKPKAPGGNVLALLRGSDPKLANEVVVLASHYDSVNWKDTSGSAPGVDDNGSGTALVMLAAQMLAKSHIKPKRSILFATFNAEEEGMVGSADFVRQLKTRSGDSFLETSSSFLKSGIKNLKKEDIKGALIVDEVAWPGRGDTKNGAIFETRGPTAETSSLVNTLAYTTMMKKDDGVNNFKINWKGFGSDHMSFLDGGIPAVLLIERDDEYHADTWGHSEKDTFEHVDLDYGAAMTRLAIRSVMKLASPVSNPV